MKAYRGVLITIKDNIQIQGSRNTSYTPRLVNFYPKSNAPIIDKLVEAGGIIVGKTSKHELAYGPRVTTRPSTCLEWPEFPTLSINRK
ncbi:amidase family protein [Pseudomonas vranovensis]|uniref:amidase family protein n=1 Tax=Pseudomonas vranovensis TaxID=321661 RepID=UPI0031592A51